MPYPYSNKEGKKRPGPVEEVMKFYNAKGLGSFKEPEPPMVPPNMAEIDKLLKEPEPVPTKDIRIYIRIGEDGLIAGSSLKSYNIKSYYIVRQIPIVEYDTEKYMAHQVDAMLMELRAKILEDIKKGELL